MCGMCIQGKQLACFQPLQIFTDIGKNLHNNKFKLYCLHRQCLYKKKSKLKVVLLISSDPLPLLLAKLNCVIVCILHVLILLTMVEGDNSF